MSRLLLAETAAQVVDFIRLGLEPGDEWVALGPGAAGALESGGLKFALSEDFVTTASQEEACRESQHRLRALCERRDAALHEADPELARLGMRPYLFHYMALVLMTDALVIRTVQLEAILKARPGPSVVAHLAVSEGDRGFAFSNQETLYGRILSLPGFAGRACLLPLDARLRAGRPMRHRLASLASKRLALISALIHLRARRFDLAAGLFAPGWPAVLAFNDLYDWEHLLADIQASGYAVHRYRESLLESPAPSAPAATGPEDSSDHAFTQGSISFWPLLRGRWERIGAEAPFVAKKIQADFERLVSGRRIRAVLSAATSSFNGHAFEQAAKNTGIPVLRWQHGFLALQDRITQFNDFNDQMTSDRVLCFGEGPLRAYENARAFPGKVAAVGSPSLDALRASSRRTASPRGGKRLLYVTTNFYDNHRYFGFRPLFSDLALYRDQCVIVDGLLDILRRTGERPLVKLSPGSIYRDPAWVGRAAGLELFKDGIKFTDLLPRCDAVVIDLPTTTVLQAAATDLPLFVLTSHFEYPKDAAEALARRAVCSGDARELVAAVNSWRDSDSYAADTRDDEFLQRYGTFRGDGRSKERALAVLRETLAAGVRS